MIRKVIMSMAIVPAMAAVPHKHQYRRASVDQRDKVLLLDNVMHGFGLCIVDKGLGQSSRLRPGYDVQWTRDRKGSVPHGFGRGENTSCWEQFNRHAL